jgi:hypothetical protein
VSLSPSDNYVGASHLGNIKENWLFQLFNQDSYLSFDGTNDSIDLGATTSSSPLSFTSSTKMSACGWVKFPTLGSTEYIFANNSIINWAGVVILKDSSNRLAILWGDTSGSGASDYELMKTNGTFSADTWTFFAITTDFSLTASNTKIWLGTGTTLTAQTVSNSGTAGITTPTYTSGRAYIARYFSTYSELDIRNLGLWTGELDSDGVTALFNGGDFLSFEENSGNYDQSSNLKGYFEFNNGENFAQDITGNVATGTITGAKYEGFLPIALRDTTVDDVFYHGVIKSSPSIRHSLDLLKSKSKTGNVSVNLINSKYRGRDLSSELFLGSNNYYNKTVRVFSQLNEMSDISECLQLYHGRLTNISHDDSSIKLSVVQKSPWDNKTIPTVKTDRGNYFPVVYGNYTKNSSTYDTPTYVETMTKLVFPVAVDNVNYYYNCPIHRDIGTTDNTLHYYEEGFDAFIPLEDSNESSTSQGGEFLKTKFDLKRHFKFKPVDFVFRNAGFDNPFNIIDGTADESSSSGTVATNSISETTTAGTTTNHHRCDISFNVPNFTDAVDTTSTEKHGLTCETRWKIENYYGQTNNSSGLNENSITIRDNGRYGGSAVVASADSITDGSQFTTNGTFDNPSANGSLNKVTIAEVTSSTDMGANFKAYNGYVDGFVVRYHRKVQSNTDGGGDVKSDIHGDLKIYDIRFIATFKVDSADTPNRRNQIEKLYLGADGLTASWDDSAITLGHQAHRDLLIRFAGMPTITPENYDTLHADRGSWAIRYWQNDEMSLKTLLEKLQFEFGFCHKIDPSGRSKYIWIHGTDTNNTFRSEDVTTTLNNSDISNLQISTTPVSQISTKSIINTQKHPARDTYLVETTCTNSTPRAKYNIKSKENTETINLDALTLAPNTTPQTDKQSDFFSYYVQANGDVKKIIECEIINNAKGYLLETGDIIQFSNIAGEMPVNPFADSWTDYYMITNLSRSPGKVKIKLREVG